jgi:hypothetical protein
LYGGFGRNDKGTVHLTLPREVPTSFSSTSLHAVQWYLIENKLDLARLCNNKKNYGIFTVQQTRIGNLEYSLPREILVTNRAGGYLNTTLVGCNTRNITDCS